MEDITDINGWLLRGSECDFINQYKGFFWGDEILSKKELLLKYKALGNDAHKWQIANKMKQQEWSAQRAAKITTGYSEIK